MTMLTKMITTATLAMMTMTTTLQILLSIFLVVPSLSFQMNHPKTTTVAAIRQRRRQQQLGGLLRRMTIMDDDGCTNNEAANDTAPTTTSTTPQQQQQSPPSSTICTRICRYNSKFYDGNVCIGCYRDTYEISQWNFMTNEEKYYTVLDCLDRIEESTGDDEGFEGSITKEELEKHAKYYYDNRQQN